MKAHRWLALLPAIGMLAGIPLANRVEPYVFGLPFLLFWIVAWVVATSGVMGFIYIMDRSAHRPPGDDSAGTHPGRAKPRGSGGGSRG